RGARQERQAAAPRLLRFCRKNGEPEAFSSGHTLQGRGNGSVVCPVLSRFTCPLVRRHWQQRPHREILPAGHRPRLRPPTADGTVSLRRLLRQLWDFRTDSKARKLKISVGWRGRWLQPERQLSVAKRFPSGKFAVASRPAQVAAAAGATRAIRVAMPGPRSKAQSDVKCELTVCQCGCLPVIYGFEIWPSAAAIGGGLVVFAARSRVSVAPANLPAHCQFSHGPEELRGRPDCHRLYKTEACRAFHGAEGVRRYGAPAAVAKQLWDFRTDSKARLQSSKVRNLGGLERPMAAAGDSCPLPSGFRAVSEQEFAVASRQPRWLRLLERLERSGLPCRARGGLGFELATGTAHPVRLGISAGCQANRHNSNWAVRTPGELSRPEHLAASWAAPRCLQLLHSGPHRFGCRLPGGGPTEVRNSRARGGGSGGAGATGAIRGCLCRDRGALGIRIGPQEAGEEPLPIVKHILQLQNRYMQYLRQQADTPAAAHQPAAISLTAGARCPLPPRCRCRPNGPLPPRCRCPLLAPRCARCTLPPRCPLPAPLPRRPCSRAVLARTPAAAAPPVFLRLLPQERASRRPSAAGHTLKDGNGSVVCPVLSRFNLPRCAAPLAAAPTPVKYCPLGTGHGCGTDCRRD
uniref:Nanos-type domain-containing protein n=1 Tax=Macrostomum lignano TaxID=282301 RepID=A0A1I8JQP0_9PLAT